MTDTLGSGSSGTALRDRHLQIETPEQVAVGYELAGPGSRFAAFLLDGVVLGACLILLVVGLFMVGAGMSSLGLPLPALSVLLAASLVLVFLLVWGYFIWYEAFRQGRTPGKAWLGLRVVQDNGFPVTLRGAVIRNLVRVVDIQPMPSCLVGGLFILLHPRAQRPGDLAAGTVVVRERADVAFPEEGEGGGPPRLTQPEYDLLRSYVLRRADLEPEARRRLATRLAAHFTGSEAGEEQGADARLLRLYAEESGRRMATGVDAGSGSPAASTLLRHQRPRWEEYRALLEEADGRGLASLPEEEVSRFAALYREVAADLARARTYRASPELLSTLERWVGTGHNLLYSPPRKTVRQAWRWFSRDFPALFRKRAPAILLAAFLLFGPALVGFGAVVDDPGRAAAIVPAGMIAHAETAAERQAAGGRYAEVPEVFMPVFSSQIITNNVQVTFLAFAGGILAGLGTAWILLFNGVLLGGVAGVFQVHGASLHLWAFVLPHGVIELTAICIAGGAGLWLGSALVVPGRRTRSDALVERGREAVSLLGGTVILLLVAGLIEGFVSPSVLPDQVKLAVGLLTAVVLFPFLLLGGSDAGGGKPTGEPEAGESEAEEPQAGRVTVSATAAPDA